MSAQAGNPANAMDASGQLAAVYATALLSLLDESGSAEKVTAEIEDLLHLIGRTEGFAAILTGDLLPRRETCALVDRVFRGRCSEAVWSFLGVLARRGRMSLLRLIARHLRAVLDARTGKVAVVAATAAALDAAGKDRVRRLIAGALGVDPAVKFVVDKRLLAGLTLRLAGHLYDASAATKLARLTQRMHEKLAAQNEEAAMTGDKPVG